VEVVRLVGSDAKEAVLTIKEAALTIREAALTIH
jgi:hypothetical protein